MEPWVASWPHQKVPVGLRRVGGGSIGRQSTREGLTAWLEGKFASDLQQRPPCNRALAGLEGSQGTSRRTACRQERQKGSSSQQQQQQRQPQRQQQRQRSLAPFLHADPRSPSYLRTAAGRAQKTLELTKELELFAVN